MQSFYVQSKRNRVDFCDHFSPSGCFFTHFLPSHLLDDLDPSEKGAEVVERVYSTSAPPLSCPKKADYNLSRVLSRGRLLCEYLTECLTILGTGEALTSPADCCWRASEEEEALELEVGRALSRLSARSSERPASSVAKESHRSSESETRRSDTRREQRSSGRRSEERIAEEQQRKAERARKTNGEAEEKGESDLGTRRLLEKNEVA